LGVELLVEPERAVGLAHGKLHAALFRGQYVLERQIRLDVDPDADLRRHFFPPPFGDRGFALQHLGLALADLLLGAELELRDADPILDFGLVLAVRRFPQPYEDARGHADRSHGIFRTLAEVLRRVLFPSVLEFAFFPLDGLHLRAVRDHGDLPLLAPEFAAGLQAELVPFADAQPALHLPPQP